MYLENCVLLGKDQDTSEAHNFCNHTPICDPFHLNFVNEEQRAKVTAGSFTVSHRNSHLSYLIGIPKPSSTNALCW